MRLQLVHADTVPRQPWRNGGGHTRELLAWPSATDPQLRVSLADIDADGPFSTFAGMRRWFAIIEGAGVELRFADGTQRMTPQDPPLHFDGAAAPGCSLLDGRTRDLNLMHRGGSATMRRIEDGADWQAGASQCGVFSAIAGTWRCADGRHVDMPARTLLWLADAPLQPMRFDARQAAAHTVCWWLAFTPADNESEDHP